MATSFNFPRDMEVFQVIQNLAELKVKMDRQKYQNFHFQNIVKYKFTSKNFGRYLSATCTLCKARLNYKKKQDHYVLTKHHLQHKHSSVENKPKIQIVTEKVKQLEDVGIKMTKQFVTKRFNCSTSTYYLARRILDGVEENTSFESLALFLSQLNY